jgi:hypothetical protein
MDTVLAGEIRPLSQVERVVDTFIAPSKTFTDVLRSTSWWLPFLLAVIFSAASAFAVDKQVGFDRVAEQAVSQSPTASDQLAQLTPEARAQRMRIQAVATKYFTYGSGIFFLIFGAIAALLNWATLNFGFGARTTFGQNFAVGMYASLPRLLVSVLNIIFLYAGVNTENFDLRNPVGTNLGYYLPDASPWLKTLLTFFDAFALWNLALVVIGTAIIARKSKGQAAIVVVGWWLVTVAVIVGLTAVTS